MSYDEKLADRIRELLAAATNDIEEKKMFGGLCFMVNEKMCVCTREDTILIRIDPTKVESILADAPGAEQMTMGGRVMKGYIRIPEDAVNTKKQLQPWIKMALNFNPDAKSSKKK